MATPRQKVVSDLVDELRGEDDLNAVQTGSPEVIDAEKSQIEEMMDSIAGVTTGEVVYWLHRASEKNKTLHGSFLMRYPKETPLIEIVEQARDKYKGGDFVLLAKKDGVLFRKAAFTCEVPAAPVVVMEKQPVDPFAQLATALEKSLIVGKVAESLNPPLKLPKEGIDPMVGMLTTILTGMQAQNTELLKLMLTQKAVPEKGGSEALMEAIKLGSALAGGKLPLDEGEGGIVEMLKPLVPYIPQVLQMLTGRRPAPSVMTRPVASVPPKPAPVPASPAAPEALEAPPQPAPPSAPEDAKSLVMRRIVDEVKFNLTLPPSPRMYEHVIGYIDAYAPEILQQAELTTADLFAAYVATLDPAFAGSEEFFKSLHQQYMAGLDAPPEPAAG